MTDPVKTGPVGEDRPRGTPLRVGLIIAMVAGITTAVVVARKQGKSEERVREAEIVCRSRESFVTTVPPPPFEPLPMPTTSMLEGVGPEAVPTPTPPAETFLPLSAPAAPPQVTVAPPFPPMTVVPGPSGALYPPAVDPPFNQVVGEIRPLGDNRVEILGSARYIATINANGSLKVEGGSPGRLLSAAVSNGRTLGLVAMPDVSVAVMEIKDGTWTPVKTFVGPEARALLSLSVEADDIVVSAPGWVPGAVNSVMYSSDKGATWKTVTPGKGGAVVAVHQGRFAALHTTEEGRQTLSTSDDGTTWTDRSMPTNSTWVSPLQSSSESTLVISDFIGMWAYDLDSGKWGEEKCLAAEESPVFRLSPTRLVRRSAFPGVKIFDGYLKSNGVGRVSGIRTDANGSAPATYLTFDDGKTWISAMIILPAMPAGPLTTVYLPQPNIPATYPPTTMLITEPNPPPSFPTDVVTTTPFVPDPFRCTQDPQYSGTFSSVTPVGDGQVLLRSKNSNYLAFLRDDGTLDVLDPPVGCLQKVVRNKGRTIGVALLGDDQLIVMELVDRTWRELRRQANPFVSDSPSVDFALDVNDANVVVSYGRWFPSGNSEARILVSRDAGSSWTDAEAPTVGRTVSILGGDIFLEPFVGSGELLRSSDAQTWTNVAVPLSALMVHQSTGDDQLVLFNVDTLYAFDPKTNTWGDPLRFASPDDPVLRLSMTDTLDATTLAPEEKLFGGYLRADGTGLAISHALFGTAGRVYVTFNGGTTWIRVDATEVTPPVPAPIPGPPSSLGG